VPNPPPKKLVSTKTFKVSNTSSPPAIPMKNSHLQHIELLQEENWKLE